MPVSLFGEAEVTVLRIAVDWKLWFLHFGACADSAQIRLSFSNSLARAVPRTVMHPAVCFSYALPVEM